jgi:hypothetical protein
MQVAFVEEKSYSNNALFQSHSMIQISLFQRQLMTYQCYT